jgi:predicted CXXCH cytochrome family protein
VTRGRIGSGAALVALLVSTAGPAAAQIVGTPHNLSATGPGPVHAVGESEVCIFCHTPHNANPATPLWNRAFQGTVYTPYSSSTMVAAPGQPTGSSKLCLSCHDGTIGLGQVLSRTAPISMSRELPERSDLTTDLSDDHPVSFAYDALLFSENPELELPELLPETIKLDENGELQCTSCHDPHSSPYPMFLVETTEFSRLCVACHDKAGWVGSSHETSNATWNGMGTDPWPHTDYTSVDANGCESCHDPHNAAGAEHILNEREEEDNCLFCHNGNVAALDIAGDLLKPHRHPVEAFLGVHDPVESFDLMPWHVECQDCHNPHAVTGTDAMAPNVGGPLNLVAGVTLSGATTESAEFEYEVCFRCHADNVSATAPVFPRQIDEPSLRRKFDLANPSFHPVAGPGQSADVPSLLNPLTPGSVIYCTACHASDNGPGAGGTGPAGPHGSVFPFLLERQYLTSENTRESPQAYALCYKCHSRSSILADESYSGHAKHLSENIACSVCHDPHGVPSGGAGDHTHLINFRTDFVSPESRTGRLEFVDTGNGSGECWLLCHGTEHDPETYGPGGD